MRLRLSIFLFGALAFAACRHVPTVECVTGCERKEEACKNEGHADFDRLWQCSKLKDQCVDACPRK